MRGQEEIQERQERSDCQTDRDRDRDRKKRRWDTARAQIVHVGWGDAPSLEPHETPSRRAARHRQTHQKRLHRGGRKLNTREWGSGAGRTAIRLRGGGRDASRAPSADPAQSGGNEPRTEQTKEDPVPTSIHPFLHPSIRPSFHPSIYPVCYTGPQARRGGCLVQCEGSRG